MINRWIALSAVLISVNVLSAESSNPVVRVDCPPGWSDLSAQTHIRGVLVSLRGPGKSSFMIARMPPEASANAAALRHFLNHVLEEMSVAQNIRYRTKGRIETNVMRNGLTVRSIRADAVDRPSLVVAAIDEGGPPLLATLASSAPEAMMSTLFGAVKILQTKTSAQNPEMAVSSDGELHIALGGGLSSRELTAEEKNRGVVLVVRGAQSEVLLTKVFGDDLVLDERPQMLRVSVAQQTNRPLEKISWFSVARSAAGPMAVYVWDQSSTAQTKIAEGFLPWSYWGYSISATGPQADEILVGTLAALNRGPRAAPGLVAATPLISIPREPLLSKKWFIPLVVVGLSMIGIIIWSKSRKFANLP